MNPIIECVPNLSEGRRDEIVEAAVEAVSRIPGVTLLDRTSDASHNRSVLTLLGDPGGLTEAVLRLYEAVLPRIDLREHKGEHPRMGAIDVLPFVPVRRATMAQCVALAREVGKLVAERFGVPVILYEEAASAPHRKNLAQVRKGEFEGLIEKLATPEWTPDFGPAHPHPSAGATAVGARAFLVAYNVQLDTPDVKIADAIARAVRGSSGGLVHVKAMGVYLEDRKQAQVSMNLVNTQKTPIHRVFELIKIEAARYGARVMGSEIIGLVPQSALLEAAAHYLQVENWDPDKMVLENRMEAAQAAEREEAPAHA